MPIGRMPKWSLILPAGCLALSGLVPACQRQPVPADEARHDSIQEVRAAQQAIQAWLDAIATLDTAAVGRYLTPTFGSIEPVGWLDRQSFLDWIPTFPKMFGGPFSMKYSLHDWHTSVRNGVAWTSLRNDGVLTVKGHEPRHMRWNESGVLLRQPDGRWLIDRYHSTFLGFQKPDSAGP